MGYFVSGVTLLQLTHNITTGDSPPPNTDQQPPTKPTNASFIQFLSLPATHTKITTTGYFAAHSSADIFSNREFQLVALKKNKDINLMMFISMYIGILLSWIIDVVNVLYDGEVTRLIGVLGFEGFCFVLAANG
ncbi:membrane protein [Perilla frutescens var. hirtella]|uniref:Membrane protein n=1 Tax=Perilla frutescens var. hirtella TaxID=608512 RepID=A0AAD4JBG1_PERFH|nr:membrane protein [Perilla frutescens var. hirtella]